MVDEGDSSGQDLLNGNIEEETEMQEVVVSAPQNGAQDLTLQIKLNFPEGVTLNDQAPNKWKIESHGESIPCASSSVIVMILLSSEDIHILKNYIHNKVAMLHYRSRPCAGSLPRHPTTGE